MKLSIDGTRAVITAGASGICRQVAELFIEHGANVFIGDINDTDDHREKSLKSNQEANKWHQQAMKNW